jgi:hypothetical protein
MRRTPDRLPDVSVPICQFTREIRSIGIIFTKPKGNASICSTYRAQLTVTGNRQ